MTKEGFRSKLGLRKNNIQRLIEINKIIEDYTKQGYRLTLRQLYYQLVSKGIIPNKVSEYAKLSTLLVKGRMAGYVDWNAIEDRLRRTRLPYWVTDIKDAIEDTINQYRLDRMQGQKNYIEVWCEKDALSNVLYRVTSEYHIPLMVNRGYSSCTAMHDAYKRFAQCRERQQIPHILYLGDHDPSGLDMLRDIQDRLEEFGIFNLHFIHIAITKKQIEMYNPPPNPAKITDPRAKWYIKEYGNISWEVDALNPKILHEILIREIEKLIDKDMYMAIIERENKDKEKLREFMDRYG